MKTTIMLMAFMMTIMNRMESTLMMICPVILLIPNELEELAADDNANANENEPNPTIDEQPNDNEQTQPEVETVNDTDDESCDDGFNDEPRRSTRVPQPVEHLTYSRFGETHSQIDTDKHVQFYDDDHRILELCHNLIAQVSPNPNDDMECTPNVAAIFARCITDINARASAQGCSFG